MAIKSLKLVLSEGDKLMVEVNTLDGAGNDVGYRGVLAAGKQYLTKFNMIWKPDQGPEVSDFIGGVGGTEPFWNGKPREEKPEGTHYPDPGTGPNPGYRLAENLPFGVGGEAWCYDLGCRVPLNPKHSPDGWLTIQADLEGITSQSGVVRIEKGHAKQAKD